MSEWASEHTGRTGTINETRGDGATGKRLGDRERLRDGERDSEIESPQETERETHSEIPRDGERETVRYSEI